MKEIKFRQPIFQKYGKFIRWHYWGFIDGDFICPVNIVDGREISQQFTGLKDIKGNDIYAGDIVNYGNRLYEVCINFNGFYLQRYKLWNGKFKPSFCYSMSLITKPFKKGERGENGGIVDSAEVIGNIHQNPEMVEKLAGID